MSSSSSAQACWEGFLLCAIAWLLQGTNPSPFPHLIHIKHPGMLMWVGDEVLSLLLFCSGSGQLQVWHEHPVNVTMNIHLLPSKDYIHAISLSVRLVLLSPSPLSLSEGLTLALGAQCWNLSQSAGTSLLLCGSICSTAALADDKWHLVCRLLEQKKVVGRDKLHQGSLGLKGALRGGHSLTKCCGSIWPNRWNMPLIHGRS